MAEPSWANDRILRVDLTQGTAHFEPFPERWQLLGGRALGARMLLEECDPACDPLGPTNLLVMAPGVISGTIAPTSGRISFCAKSPLTNGTKEANAGGEPGQQLMKLGIRAIALTGAAPAGERFGLEVDERGARLVPADELAFVRNYALCERLAARYGARASFIVVGPAGEYGLKGASIACTDKGERLPTRHAARGGLGAVMGSRGLKFVAIDPGKAPTRRPADAKRFGEICKSFSKRYLEKEQVFNYGTSVFVGAANVLHSLPTHNRRYGQSPHVHGLDGQRIVEAFATRGGGMHNCMTGCIVQCSNRVHDANGKYVTSALEFETVALLGSNCGLSHIDQVARLDRLCDDLGLDTIETGAAIGVWMDAGRLAWGDEEGMLALFDEIAQGTELGRLIGDGAAAVGAYTGCPRVPVVKGQSIAAWEPRTLHATGVCYATSGQGADHTAGLVLDPSIPLDHLARVSQELQQVIAANDSSGCCHFLKTTLDHLRALYGAFYGREVTRAEIADAAWQILQDEWEFNRRAGITRDQDRLPAWMAKEPLGPNHAVWDVPDAVIRAVYERLPVRDELFTTKTTA
jgi:aldehyde:ferredoxin oxidoreductase